jgi:hypothetical protein
MVLVPVVPVLVAAVAREKQVHPSCPLAQARE